MKCGLLRFFGYTVFRSFVPHIATDPPSCFKNTHIAELSLRGFRAGGSLTAKSVLTVRIILLGPA